MTIFEVEKFLNSYIKSKRRYKSIMLDVEEIETQLLNVTVDYTKERVKASPKQDRLANSVDRLNFLHKECLRIAEECTSNMERILYVINKVQDSTLHGVLTRKYVVGETWEQISVELTFHGRYIYELRKKALQEVKKYVEEIQ